MVDVDDLLARARTAPREVRLTCERYLTDQTLPPAQRAGLFLALGWAAFTQADQLTAADALAGAQHYRPHGPAVVDPAELLRLEAAVLIEQGQTDLASARIQQLFDENVGGNRSRLWSGLGNTHSASGDYEAAISRYDQGLDEARSSQDRFGELLLLNNRAVAMLELGRFDSAAADLLLVRGASTTEEFDYLYAISTHNLGVSEARQGRLAAASGFFSEASKLLGAAGDVVSQSHALIDQSQLFLDAGLLDEAVDSASRSLAIFEQLASARRCADAMIVQARALAAMGDWQAASELASAALQRAPASIGTQAATLARQLIYSCEVVGSVDGVAPDSERLQQVASADADLAVDAAVALADQGRADAAIALLRPLAQESTGSGALFGLHHAVASAVLAKLELRNDDARTEVVHGLELAYVSAIALGVSDLRTMTERRVRQLRDCGIELEYRFGTPAGLVEILEMARAVVLTPEPDLRSDELALLTQIRSLAKSLFERSMTDSTLMILTERRNRLERELRDLRRSRVRSIDLHGDRVDVASTEAADVVVTVHLFAHDDSVHAVVTDVHGQSEAIRVGDFVKIRRTLSALRLTLAARAGSATSPDPAGLVASLASQLSPLLDKLRDEPLIALVPEPSLDHVPWPLLLDSPVAIGPSQRLLDESARATKAIDSPGAVVVVTGPGLQHAQAEVAAVAGMYTNVLVLSDAAGSDMVKSHFSTAQLLHFATHGTFRADNPLYSSLRLEDGPLTLFDLLEQGVPEFVVFSSCDVGRSATSSSLGLASLLLSRGCRSVVASTGPVNDAAAAGLMATMHRHHAAGESMVDSLRLAQAEWIKQDPSVALFVAYGLG